MLAQLPLPWCSACDFQLFVLITIRVFSLQNTNAGRKKIQQQCIQSQAQLTPVWVWGFFPSASSNILAGFPFILCQFNFHLHFEEV